MAIDKIMTSEGTYVKSLVGKQFTVKAPKWVEVYQWWMGSTTTAWSGTGTITGELTGKDFRNPNEKIQKWVAFEEKGDNLHNVQFSRLEDVQSYIVGGVNRLLNHFRRVVAL